MNGGPGIDASVTKLAILGLACLALAGCGSIRIVTPAGGSHVAPTGSVPAQVTIQGGCSNTFQATLDGVIVTQMFSPQTFGSSNPSASFPSLMPGDHLLNVSVKAGRLCTQVSASSLFYSVGPSTIYATDGEMPQVQSDRVVQMSDDMSGAGWTSFGTPGGGKNQFRFPRGIFVYSPTKIYVADQTNNRIVMFDDMTGAGWTTFGAQGGGSGQFENPLGIFLDAQQRIYITDSETGRIIRMDDMNGTNWTQFGTLGSGTGQFHDPAGIFVDGNEKIYVSDSANDRIVRMDDMNGTNWTALGSKGAGINQFNVPNMLFVDTSGRIYITDSNNCRVVRINDMAGTGWTSIGSCGAGVLQFNGQTAFVGGVFLDTAGRIYVADAGNARLVRMDDMSGNGWITFGTSGSGTGQFANLNNVFVKPPSEVIGVGEKKR